MHSCTHVHMHTCTHALMHTCTHAHVLMHTCTHAHMPAYTHAHMHAYTLAHMHTCTHAHMQVSIDEGWFGVHSPVLLPCDGTSRCMQCDVQFSFRVRKSNCRACGKVRTCVINPRHTWARGVTVVCLFVSHFICDCGSSIPNKSCVAVR